MRNVGVICEPSDDEDARNNDNATDDKMCLANQNVALDMNEWQEEKHDFRITCKNIN